MINKAYFAELQDRKVLHKVKKNWVMISLALIGMVGAGAVSTTVVHAQGVNDNVKDQINDHFKQAYQNRESVAGSSAASTTLAGFQNQHQSNSSAGSLLNTTKSIANQYQLKSSDQITNQAKVMTNNLMSLYLTSHQTRPRVSGGVKASSSSNVRSSVSVNQNSSANVSNFISGLAAEHREYKSYQKDYTEKLANLNKLLVRYSPSNTNLMVLDAEQNTPYHANVTYYFGNQKLGTASIPLNQASSTVKASDLKYSDNRGNHYAIDPRSLISKNGATLRNGNSSQSIALDKVGHWGSATYYLTPSDIMNNDGYEMMNHNQIDVQLPSDDLYLTNGMLASDQGINGAALDDNTGLDHQSVKHLNFNNVTAPVNARNLFKGLNKLESFNGTSFSTNGTNDMSAMFSGDQALSDFHAGDGFDTSDVTDMNSMFEDDASLTSASDFSKFKTSHVTDMSNMFNGARKLNSMTSMDNWNVSRVEDVSNMFKDTDLKNADLSSWDLIDVASNAHRKDMFVGAPLTQLILNSDDGLTDNNTGNQNNPAIINSDDTNAKKGWISIVGPNEGERVDHGTLIGGNTWIALTKSKPVTVKYVNQDNNEVASDQLTGSIGTIISDVTKDKDSPIPKGYQIDNNAFSDQDPSVTFENQPEQSVTLHIIGNRVQYHTSVGITEDNVNGVHQVPITLSGNVGDTVVVDPNVLTVPKGYTLDTPDSSYLIHGKISAVLGPNNNEVNWSNAGNQPKVHYKAKPESVSVPYINQQGKFISTQQVQGRMNQTITLNNKNLNAPRGYNLKNSNTTETYKFTYQPNQTTNDVDVVGKPAGVVTIKFINQDSDLVGGEETFSHGRVGDPIKYGGIPNNYTVSTKQPVVYYGINPQDIDIHVVGKRIASDVKISDVTYHLGDGSTSQGSAEIVINGRIGDKAVPEYQSDLSHSSDFNGSMSSAYIDIGVTGKDKFTWVDSQGNDSKAPTADYWAYGSMTDSLFSSASDDSNNDQHTNDSAFTSYVQASTSASTLANSNASLSIDVDYLSELASENSNNSDVTKAVSDLASDWSNANRANDDLQEQLGSTSNLQSDVNSYASDLDDNIDNLRDDESIVSENNDVASANTTEVFSDASSARSDAESELASVVSDSRSASSDLNQIKRVANVINIDDRNWSKANSDINQIANRVLNGADHDNSIRMTASDFSNHANDLDNLSKLSNRIYDWAENEVQTSGVGNSLINSYDKLLSSQAQPLSSATSLALSSQAVSYSNDYVYGNQDLSDNVSVLNSIVNQIGSASRYNNDVSTLAQSVNSHLASDNTSQAGHDESVLDSAEKEDQTQVDAAFSQREHVDYLNREMTSTSNRLHSDVSNVQDLVSSTSHDVSASSAASQARQLNSMASVANAVNRLSVSGISADVETNVNKMLPEVPRVQHAIASEVNANLGIINSDSDMGTFTSLQNDVKHRAADLRSDESDVASAIDHFSASRARANAERKNGSFVQVMSAYQNARRAYEQVISIRNDAENSLPRIKNDLSNANEEIQDDY